MHPVFVHCAYFDSKLCSRNRMLNIPISLCGTHPIPFCIIANLIPHTVLCGTTYTTPVHVHKSVKVMLLTEPIFGAAGFATAAEDANIPTEQTLTIIDTIRKIDIMRFFTSVTSFIRQIFSATCPYELYTDYSNQMYILCCLP